MICKDCKPFKKYAIFRQKKGGTIDYSKCWVCGKDIKEEVE